MKWIRVMDEKPVIPKNKYGIVCLVAHFDPCFDEINPGRGYSVSTMVYKNCEEYPEGFYEWMSDYELVPAFEVVTHWTHLPAAPEYDPEVLNPIFKWFYEHSQPQGELKQI